MESTMRNLVNGAVGLMEKTSISVSLSDWPAAASVFAVCGTVIAVVALIKRREV